MRIAYLRGAAVISVLFVPALYVAHASESLDSWKLSQKLAKGRQAAPVSLNMEGRNSQLVYLGSLIVNGQSGCNSCHTCPSFRGGKGTASVNALNYLAGSVPFGPIKSPNLTPDKAGLPGGVTYDQFVSSMQNGQHHQDLGRFLPGTLIPNFRNLLESDLKAVYEYLRAVPPALPGACSMPGEAASK